MSFLKLTDVTKFYGSTRAVADMNLTVEKGEFVSLLGPSGCGKTTTLQMVAGFEAVSSGRIELAGATSPMPRPTRAAWASCSRPMRCSRT
jgi:putative spermidine/putrescine transport system ATP-binding protein